MKGRMNTEFGSIPLMMSLPLMRAVWLWSASGIVGMATVNMKDGLVNFEEGQFKAWHQCHAGG